MLIERSLSCYVVYTVSNTALNKQYCPYDVRDLYKYLQFNCELHSRITFLKLLLV